VIAVYRAEMLKDTKNDCILLVYGSVLHQYMDSVLKAKELESYSEKFYTWFPKWYRATFGKLPPELARWKYDWIAIFTDIGRMKKDSFTRFPNLILDEGQDFPREMYSALQILAENSSIFADDNQRIFDNNSTIDDIRINMGISRDQVKMLTRNYRNTRPIAELAGKFYTGGPSGIPDLPERKGSLPKLIHASKKSQSKMIAYYASNNPTKTVGVLVPYKNMMTHLYNEISRQYSGSIQMYYSDDRNFRNVDFTKPGVFVITWASAKGLQFDTVFLPQLEQIRTDSKIDDLSMKFYVLVSRAREELYMLSEGNEVPFVLENIQTSLYKTEKLKES
jgi:superfamily I DNA/RNA helicase